MVKTSFQNSGQCPASISAVKLRFNFSPWLVLVPGALLGWGCVYSGGVDRGCRGRMAGAVRRGREYSITTNDILFNMHHDYGRSKLRHITVTNRLVSSLV